MRADPSGAVELGEAIGREPDADRLWTRLLEGNAIVTGRLGVGKTTIARLALTKAPDGWSAQLVELKSARTGAEASAAVVEALGSPGPMRSAVEAELARSSAGVVLILDDFDRWLQAASQADATGFAEFTGTLASLCAADPKLRVVLISNTHLDRTLARLPPDPLLDLIEGCARIEVDPLSPDAGARLVMALLLGESVTAQDRAAVGRSLAAACDHVPRWIHCAVANLVTRRKPIVDDDLERCMIEAVSDLERLPWALRLELAPVLDDYQQPQRGLALSVLDQLALTEDEALSFDDLRRQLAMEATIDDDAIERVLEQLRGDQLIREADGELRFAGELLRAAWLKLRFL